MKPAPIISVDSTARVRYVVREPDTCNKVVVRYRETQWGDARPRPMQRAHLKDWD